MLKELTTVKPFFENPYKVYSAREVAKKTGSNHITVAKGLKSLSFIERSENGPYMGFKAIVNEDFLRLRLIFNIQKLWDSKIIEKLRNYYDEPIIILFGSYATATNTKDSDIDIAIISTHKGEIDLTSFEKALGHEIQLFNYTKKDINKLKVNHPELLNSLCNGIILNGELEVFI